MSLKDKLRKNTPVALLNLYRAYKKAKVNKSLKKQKELGKSWTKIDLLNHLKAMGVKEGDNLLVHSSLSKIGHVSGGPVTVIEALIECVGKNGNLLMPNSPNASLQLDYVKNLDVFDVQKSKSALGAITECFRNWPGTKRSLHPTEPVSCLGPKAEYFTSNHYKDLTPYADNSPWMKFAKEGGKILYIGVTLDNAGTSLHCLEDAIDEFKYPVYYKDAFKVSLIDDKGEKMEMITKVHNPVFSAHRKCDGLIPGFVRNEVAFKLTFGNAPTLVFDSSKMLDYMIEEYQSKGVTMYTPNGETIAGWEE